MTTGSLRTILAAAAVATVLSLMTAVATARAVPITFPVSPALTGLADQLSGSLIGDMEKSSPSDPRYYRNGVWYATDGPACWFCYDSAADGAAVLARIGDDLGLAHIAITTIDAAVAGHQLRSGAFADDDGVASQVDTGFFAVDLGVAYLELLPDLSRATRASWSAAIGQAASYLIDSGATTFYINGNVNLRQTEVMWLAWTITQNPIFLNAYNGEWAFTVSPPQSRWPGYGLHITRQPTNPDGAGGAGYLAESNTGTNPGFDPSYTQAQLGTATDLYVLTRDPRYLRLMNLEYDQLQPLVNSDWVLDAIGGTRRSELDPFWTPALSVLAASGTRPDLVPEVGPQLAAIEADYRQMANFTNVNYYKGFASTFAMPLLNVEWPEGLSAAATGTPATGTPASTATATLATVTQATVAVLSRSLTGVVGTGVTSEAESRMLSDGAAPLARR